MWKEATTQMRPLLCVLVLGVALACGQTVPASPAPAGARDLPTVAQEVLSAIQNVKNHTSTLLKELDRKDPDRQAVQAGLAEALAQAKQIKKLIEELDAFYSSMPEAQQSALRRSWSVGMILNGCMEAAQDSLAEPSADVWSEVRSGLECARRRADQLEEVLSPFRRTR